MKSVHDFIKENWPKSVRQPTKSPDGSLIGSPFPYTVPCIDDLFVNFFYWDTYFTNLGLLADNLSSQAKNNLNTMKFFVEKLGFIKLRSSTGRV